MIQYQQFAALYDKWMQNIDYAQWWQYLATTASLSKGMRVLEVGCGTGNLTEQMLKYGFSVVASDSSTEMLTQAENKLRGYPNCRLLRLDLRHLPSSLGPFDVVVAACDVVNYLRDHSELTQFLRGARSLLKPGGALLFDIHGKGRITDWRGNPYYNRVGENSCYMLHVTINNTRITQRLTGFTRTANNTWARFDELHRQTYFEEELIVQMLRENGFAESTAYEFGSHVAPSDSSMRIQIIAR